MVGNGGVMVGSGVKPDLVRAGGLAIELEAELLEPLDDLPVTEAGESAHQLPMMSG